MLDEQLRCDRCRNLTPHAVQADEELGRLAKCRNCGTVQTVADGTPVVSPLPDVAKDAPGVG